LAVKELEQHPYSSCHYFMEKEIPECLQNAWIVQHYNSDTKAIKAFLNSKVDTEQLSQIKKASSLVEAPNIDKKPNIEKLQKMFENKKEIKERNATICKAYKEGYSQHLIAKVLGLAQSTVNGIIKRGLK
jgi:DNA-directed RNA polymerase specialized sigma subunit